MIENWIRFATVVDANGCFLFIERNIFLYKKSIATWNNNDQQNNNIFRKMESSPGTLFLRERERVRTFRAQ